MASEVIYTRVPTAIKQAAEEYAAEHGLTLTNAVSELMDRGLQAMTDAPSVAQLQQRAEQLQRQLEAAKLRTRESEMVADALRERESALTSAYHALAERTSQAVGSCPHCHETVSGFDLLVTGRCPACSGGLVSLITAPKESKGALDETEFKVLMGALGFALALALMQGKASTA